MSSTSVSLVDHLTTPIVVVAMPGRITYQNRAFSDVFGSMAGQWIATAARAVGGEHGWLQGFFLTADEPHSTDVELNGRSYHVEKITRNGETGEVALGFNDVTRQREIEQAKSDFTSMIVHDLRGPLSGIQGTLEFILSGENTRLDPLHEELMREASRESERMMSLINELLDFSKIESGNFEVEKDTIRVAGVLRRAVVSLQSVAQRDEIFLLSAHSPDLPVMYGSVEKMTQAVINLISNALKFTPKRGVIAIGAQVIRDEEGPASVIVTVTDSGIGIKKEEINQIFEKYKQTKNKSFRGGSGTGLGLYIVKQIVEAHGGEIHVSSIEGLGTCIVIGIPLRRVAA